jgi:hypothetical protein
MHWSAGSVKFYLRHPLKWLDELRYNIRDSYQRIKFGWSYSDLWNMDYWFLETIPPMLRHLAEEPTYPSNFSKADDWDEWLLDQAEKLEKCKEDGIKNEYEEDFFRLAEEARISNGNSSTIFKDNPEFNEIKKKYFSRQQEIYEEQCKLISEVFNELGKHFYSLWS